MKVWVVLVQDQGMIARCIGVYLRKDDADELVAELSEVYDLVESHHKEVRE